MKYIFITVMTLLLKESHEQTVSIGEKCPPFHSAEVINYKSDELDFSDFKGQPFILMFWNTGCSDYITAIPVWDSLQKKFKGSISLVMICRESKDSVLHFFKSHPQLKKPSLPLITNGAAILNTFLQPASFYDTWINANGVVSYITNNYNLTVNHINDFLEGKKLDVFNYSPPKPGDEYLSRKTYNTVASHSLWYSSLSRCDRRVNLGEKNDLRLSATCVSVEQLFRQAYSEMGKHDLETPARIIFEMENSDQYHKPSDPEKWDKWMNDNCYTYDAVIPQLQYEDRFRFIQQDLTKYFGFSACVQKRRVKCFILVKTGSLNKLKSKGGKPLNELYYSSGRKKLNDSAHLVRNVLFNDVVSVLKVWIEHSRSIPFLDKTGFKNNIDISLRSSSVTSLDTEELRKDLKQYNLDIVQKEEWIDVLVIKKK